MEDKIKAWVKQKDGEGVYKSEMTKMLSRKKRSPKFRCVLCFRTHREIVDSQQQRNKVGSSSFHHWLGGENYVTLCSDCSLQRNPLRGFNIRRNPTYKDHCTDIQEIRDAMAYFRLDKITNNLDERAEECLLDFYKRHGFTGIPELDAPAFEVPVQDRVEFFESLESLQTYAIPWDEQQPLCVKPSDVYQQESAIPWDVYQQEFVSFN